MIRDDSTGCLILLAGMVIVGATYLMIVLG